MKKFELWHGDCLELMKNIPDGSVDLTVTSPPYDNLRTYNGNIDQWNFEKFKAIAYELKFQPDGKIKHTAILKEPKANCLVYCRLEDVKEK